jgi:ATP-binding protein involved in chromosome partitioning
MEEVGHVILVLSGKGGVGKSTVAANLAYALAERGNRVGLMDADLHGPTIPLMMGVSGEMATGTPEALEPVEAAPNLAVMSIGFLTAERDQPTIWRGPLRGGVLRQFLGDVEWGQRDFLVVDLPPGHRR